MSASRGTSATAEMHDSESQVHWKLDRHELDRAKDVDLRALGEALGVALPRGQQRSGRCPLPGHVDRHPSFWISPDARWWKCFGCQKSGDAVQLVREVRAYDLSTAVRFIEGWRNGHVEDASRPARSTEPEVGRKPDPDVYARLMELSRLGDGGRSYLASRGIGTRVINASGVGEMASERAVVERLLNDFGPDRLSLAGVLAPPTGDRHRLLIRGPAVVFPFLEDGRPMSLQWRSLREHGTRWIGLNRQRKRSYRLFGCGSGRSIWICEGITDALTAAEMGHDAVGILGADSDPDAGTLALLRGRDVYVVGDNDEMGRKFAKRILRLVSAHAIAADEFKVPSEYKDLNAWKNGRIRPDA